MYTLIYQQRFTLSTWSDCRHRRWGGTQPGPAVSWRASSLAIRDSCGFTHQQPREIQGRGMWMYWGGGHSSITYSGTGEMAWGGQLVFSSERRRLVAEVQSFRPLPTHPPLPKLTPSPPIPWTHVGWMDEVFGYAESIIWWGKERTDRPRPWVPVSTAQLWTL